MANKQESMGSDPDSRLFLAEVVVPNKKGLHARASAQFVKCAEGFDASIRVTREGQTVPGTSIMGLLALAAGQGQSIMIETEGADASQALEVLIALVECGFNEDS
jgi:phosphocarrier protein HPr